MEKLRPDDPEQLGPYKIIARLGSGGMGVVFLGSKGSRRVAVKVVRSSFLDNPSLRTRFEREIETLKKIKSTHVATYLESDVEGEIAWHAVEFINGPTLQERVEHDGPMKQNDWWALYDELDEALSEIHSQGIVHRDLKPSNIILSEMGAKLIDFGIAQDAEATSITTTGMVAGSPAWLSPEQLEGNDLGPGSDLFSAGSILVYAALGRSPWGNETTMTVPVAYQRILSRDFRLDGLPQELREAVEPLFNERESQRGFHRSAARKPADQASEVRRDAGQRLRTDSAAENPPPPAAIASATRTDAPGGRRKGWAVAGIAGAALFATAGLLFALYVQNSFPGNPVQGVTNEPTELAPLENESAQSAPNQLPMPAAECRVFSCAFATKFERTGRDTLITVWSRDSSVADLTELTIAFRSGSLGEDFASVGSCETDSSQTVLPLSQAGYWANDSTNGVVWTLLCEDGQNVSEHVILTASLPDGTVLRERFRLEDPFATTLSDWGADSRVLENVQVSPPLATNEEAGSDERGAGGSSRLLQDYELALVVAGDGWLETDDVSSFSLKVPYWPENQVESADVYVTDESGREVNYLAGDEWWSGQTCPYGFRLDRQPSASAAERVFIKDCGRSGVESGNVALELTYEDGRVSTHDLPFVVRTY